MPTISGQSAALTATLQSQPSTDPLQPAIPLPDVLSGLHVLGVLGGLDVFGVLDGLGAMAGCLWCPGTFVGVPNVLDIF